MANRNQYAGMRFLCIVAVAFELASTLANAHRVGPDFTVFFPEYSPGFHYILEEDALCGQVFQRHRALVEGSGTEEKGLARPSREHEEDDPSGPPSIVLDKLSRAFHIDQSTIQLADCILDSTPEIIKARMASAQVVLGLTPSILAVMAPGAWQTGIIATAGRRPLLALLLAAGSPTLAPSLTSGSGLLAALLQRGHGGGDNSQRFIFPPWIYKVVRDGKVGGHSAWGRVFQSTGWIIFYILGLASVANVGEVIWRLITRTALAFTLSDSWFLILWVVLGLTIHGLGAFAVWLRIKNLPAIHDSTGVPTGEAKSYSKGVKVDGHKPSSSRKYSGRMRNRIEVSPPDIASMILTWLTAIYAIVHVTFGTLVFSSILFISVLDGVTVILRLLVSVVFSRLGMEYEIAMELRDMEVIASLPVQVADGEEEEGGEEQAEVTTPPPPPPQLPETELSLPTVETGLSMEERMKRW
ncbi:hypothetical protein ACO1O0_008761 [Amphichorda felina]